MADLFVTLLSSIYKVKDMSRPFLLHTTGAIESATFPLGPGSSKVFCRFEIVTGNNWEHVSGINSGISQAAVLKHANDKIVFNLPFECVYRSTNLFGWPQILVSIYGLNKWSVETTLGYCWGHLPIIGLDVVKSSHPIRIPKDTTVLGELCSWFTSRNQELRNPKILLDGCENKQFLSMQNNGKLEMSVRTICRGMYNETEH